MRGLRPPLFFGSVPAAHRADRRDRRSLDESSWDRSLEVRRCTRCRHARVWRLRLLRNDVDPSRAASGTTSSSIVRPWLDTETWQAPIRENTRGEKLRFFRSAELTITDPNSGS